MRFRTFVLRPGTGNSPNSALLRPLEAFEKSLIALAVRGWRSTATARVTHLDLVAPVTGNLQTVGLRCQAQAAEDIIKLASRGNANGIVAFSVPFHLRPTTLKIGQLFGCPAEAIQQLTVAPILLVFEIVQNQIGGLAGIVQVDFVAVGVGRFTVVFSDCWSGTAAGVRRTLGQRTLSATGLPLRLVARGIRLGVAAGHGVARCLTFARLRVCRGGVRRFCSGTLLGRLAVGRAVLGLSRLVSAWSIARTGLLIVSLSGFGLTWVWLIGGPVLRIGGGLVLRLAAGIRLVS